MRQRIPFRIDFYVRQRGVRSAALRPGLLRADPKGSAVYKGKGEVGVSGLAGPKGIFRPYRRLEPQRRGGVTRRAVAERLDPPLCGGYPGFGFGFLIRSIYPQQSSLLLLVL